MKKSMDLQVNRIDMYRPKFLASALVPIVLLTLVQFSSALAGLQPFGVHLAFGEKPGQMVVMWHTMLPTQASTVEVSTGPKIEKLWSWFYFTSTHV